MKGIAIISVILFHTTPLRGVSVFMLPIFFVLSGYFTSNEEKFDAFIINKVRRLLVPYVFWGMLFIAINKIIERTYPVKSSLLNLLLGGQYLTGEWGTFWFINVLFISLVILYGLKCVFHKEWQFGLVAVLGFFGAMMINGSEINLPWSIQQIPLVISYMCVGIILREHMPLTELNNLKTHTSLMPLSCILLITSMLLPPPCIWI